MQVWFPDRTQSPIPLWMRMFVGSLCSVAGILMLLKHPLDFMWVPQLCLGMWFLFAMPALRRPGESVWEYWKKPRVILSSLLLAVIINREFHISILFRK
jgi:hypothetical protein